MNNSVESKEQMMAFVNEKISVEDAQQYGIDEINKDFFFGPGAAYYWTIDRERDIYFRWIKGDREDPTEQKTSFYWKGALFQINFKVTGSGKKTESGWSGWRHWSWSGMLPPKNAKDREILDSHRAEIIADLKDALVEYKDAGVLSKMSSYTVTFGF